jgi:hypothetical protein
MEGRQRRGEGEREGLRRGRDRQKDAIEATSSSPPSSSSLPPPPSTKTTTMVLALSLYGMR